MKLNAGFITPKLKEVKAFYVNQLGFGITHEMDWFIQLHTPNKAFEVSFLMPNQETQAPLFHHFREFLGRASSNIFDDAYSYCLK